MGKIYIVGIGPGGYGDMTQRAVNAIKSADIVVGYPLYLEQAKRLITADKIVVSTGMTREAERCRAAMAEALSGRTVALLSGGDAGIYGMASLMYELSAPYPELDIETVPGVTAACACGAALGGPISHDFAVISLSDRLTPWEVIEKRLRLAAEGGFIICLYNPGSKSRRGYLKRACGYIGEYRSSDTVCAAVKNAGREGECVKICSLSKMAGFEADMSTTVIVGNGETKIINGRVVTPRGYSL